MTLGVSSPFGWSGFSCGPLLALSLIAIEKVAPVPVSCPVSLQALSSLLSRPSSLISLAGLTVTPFPVSV